MFDILDMFYSKYSRKFSKLLTLIQCSKKKYIYIYIHIDNENSLASNNAEKLFLMQNMKSVIFLSLSKKNSQKFELSLNIDTLSLCNKFKNLLLHILKKSYIYIHNVG